jgi:hypothetical protein
MERTTRERAPLPLTATRSEVRCRRFLLTTSFRLLPSRIMTRAIWVHPANRSARPCNGCEAPIAMHPRDAGRGQPPESAAGGESACRAADAIQSSRNRRGAEKLAAIEPGPVSVRAGGRKSGDRRSARLHVARLRSPDRSFVRRASRNGVRRGHDRTCWRTGRTRQDVDRICCVGLGSRCVVRTCVRGSRPHR